MNSLEIQDTVQKRRIYGCFNRSLNTIRLTYLLASNPTRSELCRLAKTRTASTPSCEYALIQAVHFGSLSGNRKKIYSRCNCEPICTIYYAEARRHPLHEPFSLAVNLVRNIKSRRVFANHRNKQPLVTST